MNNIQQILAFASAARHASFARAARDLGLSPSTVAKSIARLEAGLAVKLFYRTTRQVSLTPDGRALYAQCERILEEVEVLKSVAAGVHGAPTGVLRIDVPQTYGRLFVLPVLARLLARYPGLSVEARFTDRMTDVVREGLDAVVRIGPLSDSRLVAKPFGRQHLVVCASPRYLARKGVPRAPHAIEHHDCVLFRVPTTGRERPWQFRHDDGDLELHPPSRMALGDGEALVEAAAAGLGLVQVPDYMAAEAIRAGRVTEVLVEHRPTPLPISVLYPSTRMLPPRVRVLIDALAAASGTCELPLGR